MRNTLVEGLSENRRLCGGHVRCEIESEEPVVFWELIALAAQYECNERTAMRVLDRFEGNLDSVRLRVRHWQPITHPRNVGLTARRAKRLAGDTAQFHYLLTICLLGARFGKHSQQIKPLSD
jgi:hypothetical protein